MSKVLRERRCTSAETLAHARYLRSTPVAWIADDLVAGTWRLSRARIPTLGELGLFETIFRELGGLTRVGGGNFRTSEGFAALHDPICIDKASRDLVDLYVSMLRSRRPFDMTVTVRDDPDGVERIYDGNKRCIALYESRRADADRSLGLPVLLAGPVP